MCSKRNPFAFENGKRRIGVLKLICNFVGSPPEQTKRLQWRFLLIALRVSQKSAGITRKILCCSKTDRTWIVGKCTDILPRNGIYFCWCNFVECIHNRVLDYSLKHEDLYAVSFSSGCNGFTAINFEPRDWLLCHFCSRMSLVT